jgi:cell division protein FtsZ
MFELTNETRDIKVNEAVQFVPVTELTENGIKYSLEEYMDPEPDFMAKPVAKTQKVVPAELNITMKQVDTAVNTAVDFEAISMEMTIEESLRMRLMKEEKN